MPNRFLDTPGVAAPRAGGGGNRFLAGDAGDISPVPSMSDAGDETGSSLAKVAVGGGVLAGLAALASRAPGRIGQAARGLNAIRQQLMLSGMALPKSVLGNVGAATTASIERGSTRPLRELFSGETVRDAVKAYKGHGSAGPTPGVNLPGPVPGRFMGAADEATQRALQRAGLSSAEASNEVLQTPLGQNFGKMGETLESPVASYMHPFRRTPFNQFIEGYKTMTPERLANKGSRRALAVYGTAGAVHGATTSDDPLPLTLPLATAASGRYGLPYAMAALIGRKFAGGKGGGGVAGSALPVSEYGFEQGLSDPLRPFTKPAALTALDRIFGGG